MDTGELPASKGCENADTSEKSITTSICEGGVGAVRYAGRVAWRKRISNLSILSVEQEPGPTSPDLFNVVPDILISDLNLKVLPDLKFLIVKKLLRYLNDVVLELPTIPMITISVTSIMFATTHLINSMAWYLLVSSPLSLNLTSSL